jgi:hypothetical protein
MLFLFDFDLTLVSFRGRLPRQTRHALQLLVLTGHEVGIVTNNRVAPAMLSELGLLSTIPLSRVVVRASRDEDRVQLVKRWFALVRAGVTVPFFYFDDRCDQTEAVAAAFPGECVAAYVIDNVQHVCFLVGQLLIELHTSKYFHLIFIPLTLLIMATIATSDIVKPRVTAAIVREHVAAAVQIFDKYAEECARDIYNRFNDSVNDMLQTDEILQKLKLGKLESDNIVFSLSWQPNTSLLVRQKVISLALVDGFLLSCSLDGEEIATLEKGTSIKLKW